MGFIGSVRLQGFFDTYDLNLRAAVQVVQAVLAGLRAAARLCETVCYAADLARTALHSLSPALVTER